MLAGDRLLYASHLTLYTFSRSINFINMATEDFVNFKREMKEMLGFFKTEIFDDVEESILVKAKKPKSVSPAMPM